ncbi:selenide, water dikinase [Synchytrium microbalum]|uniref:Selenide, water dikinase n=1 Tax=Synchytrium microbalum TaxID=1806994 RepID=A0A507C7W8_9FUNG|nr:selenide, water dikinase [Synchytrium microbalum]TPX35702.1 selenide, water dikinase [Synchytrium microbalum]
MRDGNGMDASIQKTKIPGIVLVETMDVFYPLVDDPYIQGRITCANVLSDLYAMGVSDCDNMLMYLGIARKMSPELKETVTKLFMRGFHDLAHEAGTKVTGGQTIQSPWYTIGGSATSVVQESEVIMPIHAKDGDVLVLTKPLGNQLAVNAHTWLFNEEKYNRVRDIISKEHVVDAYETAIRSMCRLNRNAAKLMHQHSVHASTDVTGFGILGHAENLASNQEADVDFVIDTLPIIDKMWEVNAKVNFKLEIGRSAETSGGLLIALPAENADAYIKELESIDECPAWIVGRVVSGTRKARLAPNPTIIPIPYRPLPSRPF